MQVKLCIHIILFNTAIASIQSTYMTSSTLTITNKFYNDNNRTASYFFV